ncbi:MAG: RidA family protein [Rhodocyclaceae bacterium]|nr:RidA family protein [Rhodocyclaceae bacterium]MCP5232231.1 RidA family protein [Zoogloeaceae bacterium]MCB1911215.1 RidA family protein [Rhodocyclaceae bacterium]MCP5240627.1 RidA family protein [Zoogloeaceae bacterium]MCP5253260.1 RidA family protein [Zoogloeaceae bacterium]
MDIQRYGTTRRYSDIVSHNGTLYTVEVPSSEGTDIATQTREVLASLEALLERAGSSKSRILMATVYLTEMADYDGMNQVWDAWLPEGSAPCRACVRVAGLANPGWRVEIALNAAL